MTLRDRIQDDMKAALRAQEKQRLAIIRLILAAIKQREVDERITLDDAQVIAVLERMIKQRRESIEQYRRGAREDLAAQESYEIDVIQIYMPALLGADEIDALITQAIAATGAQTVRDMGKVMNQLKTQAQGRADMAAVSALVKSRLGG